MTQINYAQPATARRPARRTVVVAFGIFVLTLVMLAVGFVTLSWWAMSPPRVKLLPFNSTQWQAASTPDATYNSVRLRMADSFLAVQRPVGKTRAQIVALLGEPDDTPYFRNYDMVYYLGPERGPMSIDSEWLVLKLSNGVVVEARLVTD